MSASELAREAGVSTSTVTRIEQGTLDPTVGMLHKLLAAAGTTLRLEAATAPGRPELARLARAWSASNDDVRPDWTALRSLLDRLRREPSLVPDAIRRQPPRSGSAVMDALLAGIADKLADDAGIERPAWTRRGRRLRKGWAPAGTPRQTAYRREHTPPQLARRNLIVDASSLWRDAVDA